MFNNAKQSIPHIFNEKMRVDQEIKHLKQRPVVHLEHFRTLKDEQDRVRHGCKMFISQSKVGGYS